MCSVSIVDVAQLNFVPDNWEHIIAYRLVMMIYQHVSIPRMIPPKYLSVGYHPPSALGASAALP